MGSRQTSFALQNGLLREQATGSLAWWLSLKSPTTASPSRPRGCESIQDGSPKFPMATSRLLQTPLVTPFHPSWQSSQVVKNLGFEPQTWIQILPPPPSPHGPWVSPSCRLLYKSEQIKEPTCQDGDLREATCTLTWNKSSIDST